MHKNKAIEIIKALADGIDPTTGEVLPEDSVCNKGDIVRALYTVLECFDTNKSKKQMPENTGKPWTKEDENLLMELFHSGTSKKDICKTFKRTSTGIAARLVRLGVIKERDEFRDRK